MWTGAVPFSQMHARGRWKVEFYCGPAADMDAGIASPYPMAALGELLAERHETVDPQQFPEHVFNYIGLEHVESDTGELIDFTPRTGAMVRSRSKIYRRGDVLYGRLRPYLNKVFVADGRVGEGLCSGEFFVLTPRPADPSGRPGLRPHVARAVLASELVRHIVRDLVTGSALPRLALDELLAIEVPLPPPEVQAEIEALIRRESARRRELRHAAAQITPAIEREVLAILAGKSPDAPDIAPPPEQRFVNPLPEALQ
jgi:hypothetical protein